MATFGNTYNPYVQAINPMLVNQQQRLTQMEQMYPQFQQQPSGIAGRIVDDVNTIAANEVPMDGSPSVFIKRDMSEMYLKRWNQNGTIDTLLYKVFVDVPSPEPTNNTDILKDSLMTLQQKMELIDDKLTKALTPTTKPKTSTKKEVEAE